MINLAPITALLVPTVGQQLAALAEPSGPTDGVDISSWGTGAVAPIRFDAATVYIDANGAATLTGPINLWGYRVLNGVGRWSNIGMLNSGLDLVIAAPGGGVNRGIARRINEVGVFSRLAIACATVTGARLYDYYFEPIAIRGA